MTKKILFYFIVILAFIILDQASKSFLIAYLKTKPGYVLEIFPILDFVYAWNYGISFGLFREYYQYSNTAFLILNSLIVVYLIFLLVKTHSCLSIYGLTLIVSGALGNLIDRVFRGAVFDFIYFNYQEFSFPAFNLADSFITIGAAIFIYDYLFKNKTNK